MLTGTVANFANFPTILDPVTGRATGVEADRAPCSSRSPTGTPARCCFRASGAEFRERYEVSIDPQQYFDESGTAIKRVSRDVATVRGERDPGAFLT